MQCLVIIVHLELESLGLLPGEILQQLISPDLPEIFE